MDEFVEKFNMFKEWLYQEQAKCSDNGYVEEESEVSLIINKFEELGLDFAF